MSIPFRSLMQRESPPGCAYCNGVVHNRKCLQCGATQVRTETGWSAVHDDTPSARYIVAVFALATLIVLLAVGAMVGGAK